MWIHVAPARAVRDREAVVTARAEDRLLILAEGPVLLALQIGDGVVGLALPWSSKRLSDINDTM
jgi:hypothetical protein